MRPDSARIHKLSEFPIHSGAYGEARICGVSFQINVHATDTIFLTRCVCVCIHKHERAHGRLIGDRNGVSSVSADHLWRDTINNPDQTRAHLRAALAAAVVFLRKLSVILGTARMGYGREGDPPHMRLSAVGSR